MPVILTVDDYVIQRSFMKRVGNFLIGLSKSLRDSLHGNLRSYAVVELFGRLVYCWIEGIFFCSSIQFFF